MDDGDRTIIILALGGSLKRTDRSARERKRRRAVVECDKESDCDTANTSPHLTRLTPLLDPRPRRLSRTAKREQAPAYRETQKAPLETPAAELEKKTSAGE